MGSSMSNPYALAPNRALLTVNTFAVDLGTPAVADAARIVASTNMKVGSYTIANASSVDGIARNVTVTATAVTGNDTVGTITVTGTNVEGTTITEALIPVQGSTVAGNKAFKTVTDVTGAGWVISSGNDTITVGFGNKLGFPATIDNGVDPLSATSEIFAAFLGAVGVTPTINFSSSDISLDTIDCSAGTYNGTKRLVALLLRA